MRLFLATMMATITQKPRYLPKIEWSSVSWTHNVFRVWELVFGRRVGVRAEMSTATFYKDGKWHRLYSFHTVEAAIAHFEGIIRGSFESLIPSRVYFPQLANMGTPVPSPFGILMAVAYDAASNNSATSKTITVNHTCTGSDRFIALMGGGRATISSASYNSVATTSIGAASSGVVRCGMHGLLGPASGTNTLSVTFSSGTNAQTMGGVSFTGAGGYSNANTGSGSSTTASVTVSSVSGSLCVDAMDHGDQGIATATGSGQTARWTSGSGSDADGMSTIAGAASVTFSWTRPASSVWAIVGVSINVPSTNTANPAFLLNFM